MAPRSLLLRTSRWVGAVVLACGLVLTCVAVLADRPGPASRPATPTASADPQAARTTSDDPRDVLRQWDRQRAAAWVARDPRRLAGLYTAGSVAGRRDVQLLRRWTARSLRVTRLEPQVLALRVVRAGPGRLVLRVTDRVGVLRAELDGRPVALPSDQVSTRRVVLQRADDDARWRVASVTG